MSIRSFAYSVLILLVAQVGSFAQQTVKRDIAILFDNSGSMFSQIDRQREIAKAIVSKVAADSTISLYGFAADQNGKQEILSFAAGAECSSDVKTIQFQLDNIQVARGQTILIDGLAKASERLSADKTSGCGKDREKILVLISDGEDRARSTKPGDVVKQMRELKVKAFVIGLIDDLRSESGFVGKSPAKKSKDFLASLANGTEGRVVIAKKKSTPDQIVSELFTGK